MAHRGASGVLPIGSHGSCVPAFANGREDVPCNGFAASKDRHRTVLAARGGPVARGDLIRSSPSRSFPDIAGDIVGTQTYTYDPVTQTGIFQVVNAPHLISLGPSPNDMFQMLPEHDGTLTQSLQMKLDRHGKLINSPANTFEIRGTVVIGDQTYQGVLLKGTPTAFGAVLADDSPAGDQEGRSV